VWRASGAEMALLLDDETPSIGESAAKGMILPALGKHASSEPDTLDQ
jgi:hypothetical protein